MSLYATGPPVNVLIRRMVHCINIIPANDAIGACLDSEICHPDQGSTRSSSSCGESNNNCSTSHCFYLTRGTALWPISYRLRTKRFESQWRRNSAHDCAVLRPTKPFIITLPSSQYDLSKVKRVVRSQISDSDFSVTQYKQVLSFRQKLLVKANTPL